MIHRSSSAQTRRRQVVYYKYFHMLLAFVRSRGESTTVVVENGSFFRALRYSRRKASKGQATETFFYSHFSPFFQNLYVQVHQIYACDE